MIQINAYLKLLTWNVDGYVKYVVSADENVSIVRGYFVVYVL